MTQADPSKEASTVEKMNGRSLSRSLQIKLHTALKNVELQVVFWKEYIVFTKISSLK